MDYGKEYRRPGNMRTSVNYPQNNRTQMQRDNSCGCAKPEAYARAENIGESDDCAKGCIAGDKMTRLKGWPLAMVYSPDQEWDDICEPEAALRQGTLFQSLYFAWTPEKCAGSCHDSKCR